MPDSSSGTVKGSRLWRARHRTRRKPAVLRIRSERWPSGEECCSRCALVGGALAWWSCPRDAAVLSWSAAVAFVSRRRDPQSTRIEVSATASNVSQTYPMIGGS